MKLEFKKFGKENSAQTLVVFAFKAESREKDSKASSKSKDKTKEKSKSEKSKPVFGPVDDAIKHLAAESDFTGNGRETIYFRNQNIAGCKNILLVGLGNKSVFSVEALRQATADAYKVIAAAKVASAGFHFSTLNLLKAKKDVLAQAMTEGLLLAAYNFDECKSKKEKNKTEEIIFFSEALGDKKLIDAGIDRGTHIAEAINFSRRLGDTPGNLMTPTILANETKAELSKHKVKVSVWDKAKIKQEKMGGLYGVSLGSAEEPRFIIMEYKGAAGGKKPICIVGKGLTFDSGGISIKPATNMEEMKFDMCGGANTIGIILAAARLKLKINLLGLVPASENMPGCAANKPGDIFTARNGKTVEVNNTDAEGRLILADALSYASEQKPEAIFDMATLTGAMVIALGNIHTGFFTRRKELVKKIHEAADQSGERLWYMPLTDTHLGDMKGTYADLSNVSSGKGAGSATAAAFLEQFVDEDIPWAHFDIAGTAYNTGDRLSYNPKKGASGVIIRTFIELLKNY